MSMSPEWNSGPDPAADELAEVEARRRVGVAQALAASAVGSERIATLAFVSRLAAQDMAVLSEWEREICGEPSLGPERLALILDLTAAGFAAVIHAATEAMMGAAAGGGRS